MLPLGKANSTPKICRDNPENVSLCRMMKVSWFNQETICLKNSKIQSRVDLLLKNENRSKKEAN